MLEPSPIRRNGESSKMKARPPAQREGMKSHQAVGEVGGGSKLDSIIVGRVRETETLSSSFL